MGEVGGGEGEVERGAEGGGGGGGQRVSGKEEMQFSSEIVLCLFSLPQFYIGRGSRLFSAVGVPVGVM